MAQQKTNFPSYPSLPPSYHSTNPTTPWAPPLNGASEHDALLPAPNRAPKHTTTSFPYKTVLIIVAFILGAFLKHANSTSLFNPAVRDKIRRQWDVIYAQHEQRLSQMHNITAAWESEIERHSEMRLTMAQERAQWDSERRAWEKVREEERMEEVERRRREREKEVEEEERQRAGIHWLALERSEHCERYGTRKYQAKLGPVGGGYDRLKACRTTEIEIHGRKMKPTYCEDTGTYHGVWGHWFVDFDEGGCRPWWENFTDRGCTASGSGLRRIDAELKNLDSADKWDVMCSSTPADFNGLHYDGAMSCAKRIILRLGVPGVFGVWDIDDERCR